MIKSCPDPVDVQDLQFKLHCRLKVFNNKELDAFPKQYSLISCASRYGLLFIGSNTTSLQVIQLKCVENYSPKDKEIPTYPRRNVPLPSRPQHVSVNCDNTIVAVVTERENCATVSFYDVLSFYKQSVSLIKEARLSSTPGVSVSEIGWNPALPGIFTACKSDGTLGVYEIQGDSISINEIPAAAQATCFCWSPKGKQIAVGSKNGQITQYKPDLKAVKITSQPPLDRPHSLISLQWVSNYQFIGIYQSPEPEGAAKLIVVDAPKTGDPTYTNYEDICYSGTTRLAQFYMILQQHWNILVVASSNSTELGVLGSSIGETWAQWILSDTARAELPLSSDHQETLPVGLAYDISSTKPLPWNESSIPPCPYLLLLSHHGTLCFFNMVNLKEGAPSICTPPDLVSDLSGISQFTVPSEAVTAPPVQQKEPPPSFGTIQSQNTPASQAPVFGAKVVSQPQQSLFGSGVKLPEGTSLFGGQATLTPIKPQPQLAPRDQVLITPISKQQTGTNQAEKYTTIFSALDANSSTATPPETKPIVIPIQTTVPKPAQIVEQQPKAALGTGAAPKPPEPPKSTLSLKMKEETEVLLAQILKDECTSLETELKALLHQGKLLKVNVGTDKEKDELVTGIESLQEFIKEIVDISAGENAEVHYLKQNLIQSWAWFEEARSRYNASKDETVSLLLRSQPLDSATEKRRADISKMMYYLESQITQASKALDEQWDNFQDYAKKVYRTKMPTMEAIFQAMVRQNVIMQKQSYILKDIGSKLKSRGRSANVPSLLLSVENVDDLENSLNRLQIDHPADVFQTQYDRVLHRMKNLSEVKTRKLRSLLKTRDVFHVTATKPQLSSSLMLQSPESKTKRLLSNLAALGTASPRLESTPTPKALSFVHSTPIRENKTELKPIATPPNTPQIDAKTFTFKKIEKSSTDVPLSTSNSFIPVAKSTSAFSNLLQEGTTQVSLATHAPSAFVPTQVNAGGGNKLFNFPSITTAKSVPVTTTASTFTFTPKFGGADATKTTDATKMFNFGAGLTITPVAAPTKTAATKASKPSFNFGDASNVFGTKITTQAPAVTSSSNIFSNLSQPNRLFGATTTSSTAFGTVQSAFSAVTTSASALNLTAKSESVAGAKPSVFANTSSGVDSGFKFATPPSFDVPVVTTSSMKTSLFGNVTATTSTPTVTTASTFGTAFSTSSAKPSSIFGNVTVPSTSTTAAVTSTSMFGGTTFGASSIFGNTVATTSPAVVTSASLFGGTTVTTASKSSYEFGNAAASSAPTPTSKPSSVFQAVPPTTVSNVDVTSASVKQPAAFGSTESSGTSILPVSTAASPLIPTGTVAGTTTPSLPFGASQTAGGTTSSTSIFAPSTAGSTNKPSVFATTTAQSSVFGTAVATPSVFGTAASQQSVTASQVATSPPSSVFGTAAAAFGNTTTTTQSIFGAAKTTPSSQATVFGSTAQSPIFGATTSSVGTTTQATLVFSTSASAASTAFGTTAPTIFGTSTATKTTATPIFGSTATTQSSIFGGASPSATTQSSVFGTSSTQSSAFGSSASIFATPSTQQSSVFGGTATTTTPGSIFGASPVFGTAQAASTTKSIFGGAAQGSIFASSTTTSTQSSVFGTPATTATTFGQGFGTQSSPFAQASPAFGTTQTTTSFGGGFATPSVFGAATSSVFGQPATFSASTPAFGGATPTSTSNVFGAAAPAFGANTSANVFGSTAVSSPSLSFAGAASNASNAGAFGFGGLNVGSPTSTASSVFGGSSTFGQASAANPFGRTTEQKSPFGAAASNIFASPASTSGSIFGSNAGSTFSSNTQGGFGSSTFGSPSAFGQQSSVFGQSSQSTFGNSSFGSVQPGPFSSGGGGVAQTGFGSPSGFAKPTGGFGSPPSFGGSPQPAFGAAPSFGGAPTFGSAATFGSPGKVFGSSAPSVGFGSSTTGNTGFGNLANQNTVGFGNLAQQTASPTSTPFSGSSSFSSWR